MTQIDPTKRYQTRVGEPVRILCVDAPGDYPVIGYIDEGDGDAAPENWTASGRYYRDIGAPHNCAEMNHLDLVEVPEKRRLTGWLNVYRIDAATYCTHWSTKALADSVHSCRRVACIDLSRIEYTVGEGLK